MKLPEGIAELGVLALHTLLSNIKPRQTYQVYTRYW